MKKGPRNRALKTGERQCVYLDNFSKMRRSLRENDESIINILSIVLFIPASHKQTSYNNYMSMVTSRPSAGKSITASKVFR